jgi:hypothetical protein
MEFFDFFEKVSFLLYSFKTVWGVFHDLKNGKKFENRLILAHFVQKAWYL